MSPRIEKETTITLENGSSEIRRELIADLPEISGVYETSLGTISMRIAERIQRETGLQKVVFKGEAMGTKNSLRRVILFSVEVREDFIKSYRRGKYLPLFSSRIF